MKDILSELLRSWIFGISPDQVFYDVLNLHVLKLESLCNLSSILSFITTWRTHYKDSRWSAGSHGSGELESAYYLLKNNTLRSVAIDFYDRSSASLLDSLYLTK